MSDDIALSSSLSAMDLISGIRHIFPEKMQTGHVIGAGIALGVIGCAAYAISTIMAPAPKFRRYRFIKPDESRKTYVASMSALICPLMENRENCLIKEDPIVEHMDDDETEGSFRLKPPGIPVIYKTNPKGELLPGHVKFLSNPENCILICHSWPRGRFTPCIFPFGLKLETFFRVYGVQYQVDSQIKGHTPPEERWVAMTPENIIDCHKTIQFVCEKLNIDPDDMLEDLQECQGRAYMHLLEDHLYWLITAQRWIFGKAKSLEHIVYLPHDAKPSVAQMIKRMKKCTFQQGFGKMDPHEAFMEVLADLEALSELLGEKRFFLSEVYPSEMDCSAFSILAQMLWNMKGTSYQQALSDVYPNLEEYCIRFRDIFWPDWNTCLNNIPFGPPTPEESDSETDLPLPPAELIANRQLHFP